MGSIKDIGANQVGFTTNADPPKSMAPPMGKPSTGMSKLKSSAEKYNPSPWDQFYDSMEMIDG